MPSKTAAKKAPTRKKAAAPSAAAQKRGVSDQQKQAMQQGRTEGAHIRRYLDALKVENAPKRRGRRRTPDEIRSEVARIDATLSNGVDTLEEVSLRQRRLLLVSDLQETEPKIKSADYEDDFVKSVKGFSERKGIAYDVWRELGVPVVTLRKAGITR